MQDDNSLLNIETDPILEFIEYGEEIIWRGKPKMSAFILSKFFSALPVVLLFIAFDSFLVYTILSGYKQYEQEIPIYVILIIFAVGFTIHLFPAWRWLWNVITARKIYKNTEYCITDRKVIIQVALIIRRYEIIHFYDVSWINSKINFFEKKLGIGNVRIYVSRRDALCELNSIADAQAIQNKLIEIVKNYKRTHKDLVKKIKEGNFEEDDDFEDEYEFLAVPNDENSQSQDNDKLDS